MRELFSVGDLVQWKIYKVDGNTSEVTPNKYFEVNLLTLTLLKD